MGPKVPSRANTDRPTDRPTGSGQVQPVVVAAAVILTCASVRLPVSFRPSVCGSAATAAVRLIGRVAHAAITGKISGGAVRPLSPRSSSSVRRVRFRHFRNREGRIKKRREMEGTESAVFISESLDDRADSLLRSLQLALGLVTGRDNGRASISESDWKSGEKAIEARKRTAEKERAARSRFGFIMGTAGQDRVTPPRSLISLDGAQAKAAFSILAKER